MPSKVSPDPSPFCNCLNQDIDQELARFCKNQGVTVEVFLEAS
ncbi:hypothetical protein [Microcoleus sp. FACHB-831]|nr:hypothetical protein [Microcoleus sp. FACHB-831]